MSPTPTATPSTEHAGSERGSGRSEFGQDAIILEPISNIALPQARRQRRWPESAGSAEPHSRLPVATPANRERAGGSLSAWITWNRPHPGPAICCLAPEGGTILYVEGRPAVLREKRTTGMLDTKPANIQCPR